MPIIESSGPKLETKAAGAGGPARVILLGIMGRTPLAGVIWQVLHYLEGFRRLGFDVYYVEDTESWTYDPERNTMTDDCSYAVRAIGETMARLGLSDRWAYRSLDGRLFGLSDLQLRRLLAQADILVNLTASTLLRDEHLRVPLRIYLETDPVLPQIEVFKNNPRYVDLLATHTHHFSFGENLGAPDCGVPVGRFRYLPTRQPVVLDWWAEAAHASTGGVPARACFTTVANWRQSGKDFEWNGEHYTWSKHHEFLKIVDLPRRTTQSMELALALQSGAGSAAHDWSDLSEEDACAIGLLQSHGWRVVNALSFSTGLLSYREYILRSRGEFTVAKDQNVRLRSGWSSDRSACYLAAGRPVVTQDTGFGKCLPTGEGLFSFHTAEDAVAALEAINADYPRHCRAARAIAEEYFSVERVLGKMLDAVASRA